jgi:hypothetical protein
MNLIFYDVKSGGLRQIGRAGAPSFALPRISELVCFYGFRGDRLRRRVEDIHWKYRLSEDFPDDDVGKLEKSAVMIIVSSEDEEDEFGKLDKFLHAEF